MHVWRPCTSSCLKTVLRYSTIFYVITRLLGRKCFLCCAVLLQMVLFYIWVCYMWSRKPVVSVLSWWQLLTVSGKNMKPSLPNVVTWQQEGVYTCVGCICTVGLEDQLFGPRNFERGSRYETPVITNTLPPSNKRKREMHFCTAGPRLTGLGYKILDSAVQAWTARPRAGIQLQSTRLNA